VENLEDALKDLEMVLDEDEPIRYDFGTGTIEVTFGEAQEKVQKELKEKRAELSGVLAGRKALEAQMAGLKGTLTSKFGDAIRLD